MSKKQRLKKELRLVEAKREQLATITRRKERLAPLYTFLRSFFLTLAGTTLLLVVGVIINNHLVDILKNIPITK